MKTNELPKPVIIPGIMETLREIKDRISLDIMNMTYEEEIEYLRAR
ncbi:hypothetical protein AGMMS49982_18230 [Bacteroidia bacterium]|nr:hypothetical protein AGMMS49982_18230 [Bacteroidia bacterium]